MTKPQIAVEKPEPPEDLWEKLDTLLQDAMKETAPKPPEGSFLPEEFAQRRGLSASHARKILAAFVTSGKLKRTKVGAKYYYLFPR